ATSTPVSAGRARWRTAGTTAWRRCRSGRADAGPSCDAAMPRGASGQLAVSVLSQPVPAMPMARARTLRPVVVRSRNMTVLRPLEDRGDAHAAGGADRDKPATGAFLFQQLGQRRHDARA